MSSVGFQPMRIPASAGAASGRASRTWIVMRATNGQTQMPLHDDDWTGRLLAGRGMKLDNPGRVLAAALAQAARDVRIPRASAHTSTMGERDERIGKRDARVIRRSATLVFLQRALAIVLGVVTYAFLSTAPHAPSTALGIAYAVSGVCGAVAAWRLWWPTMRD